MARKNDNKTIIEKPNINIHFVPIICATPLIYAHNYGLFKQHGLNVNLVPSPGFSGIKELMAYDKIDVAHMLATMPLASSLGIDGKKADIRLTAIQHVNGQALTLSKKHIGINHVKDMKGFVFGVPYRFSIHYYLLCYFLASHGLNPLTDVTIKEVSPVNMPYLIKHGHLDGIFAPEPYNQLPVYEGTGFIYILSKDIWNMHPCCCFAMRKSFIDKNPNTYRALLLAILESERKLHFAQLDEKKIIARDISKPEYLNQKDPILVEQILTGIFPDGTGKILNVPDRLDFIPYAIPDYGTWMLNQMYKVGDLPKKLNYQEIIEEVFYTKDSHEMADALGFSKKILLKKTIPIDKNTQKVYKKLKKNSAMKKVKKIQSYQQLSSVKHRLQIINAKLAEVTAGNLNIKITETSKDEIGDIERLINEILATFNTFAISQQEYEENLQTLASTDPLTQIANRGELLRVANLEFERTVRYKQPYGVLMIDLDHFKLINDQYGHQEGDKVLIATVKACLKSIRKNDLMGRYGGEEFVVLFPQTRLDKSKQLAERLRQAVEAMKIQINQISIKMTISIGVTIWNEKDKSIADTIKRADKNLYKAKSQGRNQVIIK